MPVLVDIRTRSRSAEPLALVSGYAAYVLEVSDVTRALHFYCDLLGFAERGQGAEGTVLAHGDGEVVLVERASPKTLPETGVHWAFRYPASTVEDVAARLVRGGVAVHRYREDRAAERADPRYAGDPDGNRIQLVAGERAGFDHAAIETHDLEWSEVFYTQVLGGVVEARVGWRMDDYVRAWAWGRGEDQCAPGTRRHDKRYTRVENEAVLPRPNAQVFVALAPGVVLGVYLATEHRQEPPPSALRGTPRLAFRTTPAGLDQIERRLREVRLRCLPVSSFGGPFERDGDAIFARDPGGNFIELRADGAEGETGRI